MRTKLRNMLELWGEAGLLVYLTLSNGEELEGVVKEIDQDELLMELRDEEGNVGTLCVVMVDHIVTATYVEEAAEEAITDDELAEDDAAAAGGD
jgi:hypothetical protein